MMRHSSVSLLSILFFTLPMLSVEAAPQRSIPIITGQTMLGNPYDDPYQRKYLKIFDAVRSERLRKQAEAIKTGVIPTVAATNPSSAANIKAINDGPGGLGVVGGVGSVGKPDNLNPTNSVTP